MINFYFILGNKMNKLTGIKDLDREILSKMNDIELLTVCQIDKRFYYDICDDNFLRRRLNKYQGIEKYKKNETWKQFFLNTIYTITKMKADFQFIYTKGDFQKQYKLFKMYPVINNLLVYSAKEGELPLVIYSISKGADINEYSGLALRWAAEANHYEIVKYLVENGANDISLAFLNASMEGNIDIVKYLVEKGANIHFQNDQALILASIRGRLRVVKYLIEKGADIHINSDQPLRDASEYGHLGIVEYLIENSADIHAEADAALIYASKEGHYDIVKYLVENGADVSARNFLSFSEAKENGHEKIVEYLENL